MALTCSVVECGFKARETIGGAGGNLFPPSGTGVSKGAGYPAVKGEGKCPNGRVSVANYGRLATVWERSDHPLQRVAPLSAAPHVTGNR